MTGPSTCGARCSPSRSWPTGRMAGTAAGRSSTPHEMPGASARPTRNPAQRPGCWEALRGRPGWDRIKSTRRLAGLLNPLGIVRQQIRTGDRRRWCYVLQGDQLADLRARFAGAAEAGEEAYGSDPTSFPGPDPVTSGATGDNPHE